MSYTANKGMFYPLKASTRDSVVNSNTHANLPLVKDMFLEMKLIGAKKDKIYRLEWIGLGTTAWGTANWEALVSEYDESTFSTSSAGSKKDIIKLFDNNYGKTITPNGIYTMVMFSPDGSYTLVLTADFSELATKSYAGQSLTLNDKTNAQDLWTLIIDPDCYQYTAARKMNFYNYTPAIQSLQVYGRSGRDDYRFLFDQRTVNNLFALYNVHKRRGAFDAVAPFVPGTTYPNNTVYGIATGKTDWVGPYVMKAVNNGDASPTLTFTGGAHSSLNNPDTGNPTARTTLIEVVVDGNKITTPTSGFFDKLDVYVKQEIMSYNTIGSGRYTHMEVTHYSIKGTKIEVDVTIIPYEQLKLFTYYGLQADVSYYDNVIYKNGTSYARGINSDSGAKPSNFVDTVSVYHRNATESCDEILEMKMDNTIGLGKRQSVDDTLSTIFATTANKIYMRLCGFYGNTKEMDLYPNYVYQWKGSWEFKSIY